MRKVIFTEEQMKTILGEEYDMFLSDISGEEIPANSPETEVFSNVGNADDDVPQDDVTTADELSQKKTRQNSGIGYFPRMTTRMIHEGEHDSDITRFTKNQKKEFSDISANGGSGKMLNNIIKDKGKAELNTNRVRLHRMKEYEKTNPEQFLNNGGKAAMKALKSTVSKENTKNSVFNDVEKEANPNTITPNANTGNGKSKQNKTKAQIYYY